MAVTITWHGHASLSLDINGNKVLIDPYFTGCPTALVDASEVSANYILLTHGHGDHVTDQDREVRRSELHRAELYPRVWTCQSRNSQDRRSVGAGNYRNAGKTERKTRGTAQRIRPNRK